MDSNLIDNVKNGKPLSRKLYVILYVVLVIFSITLNALMVYVMLRDVDKPFSIIADLCDDLLIWANSLFCCFFAWLGSKLRFNQFVPLAVIFLIGFISITIPYLVLV